MTLICSLVSKEPEAIKTVMIWVCLNYAFKWFYWKCVNLPRKLSLKESTNVHMLCMISALYIIPVWIIWFWKVQCGKNGIRYLFQVLLKHQWRLWLGIKNFNCLIIPHEELYMICCWQPPWYYLESMVNWKRTCFYKDKGAYVWFFPYST